MSINSLPELVKVFKYEVTVMRLNPQIINTLSANPTKWSNTPKEFAGKSLYYQCNVALLCFRKYYENVFLFMLPENIRQPRRLGSDGKSLDPLSASPIKWSNILKQFVGNSRRIVWVCLTILWGWRLKG